jgi:hypothetical protein
MNRTYLGLKNKRDDGGSGAYHPPPPQPNVLQFPTCNVPNLPTQIGESYITKPVPTQNDFTKFNNALEVYQTTEKPPFTAVEARKLMCSKIIWERGYKSRGPQVAQQLYLSRPGVPITSPNSTHYLLHLHLSRSGVPITSHNSMHYLLHLHLQVPFGD